MKNCKICWGVNIVLIGAAAFAAYLFIFGKPAQIADDGRTAIVMTRAEKEMVLGEMRAFLEAVQAITEGVVDEDLAYIADSAYAVGMAATGGEPAALIAKLPLEFKQLGMGTHQAFDKLGNEATDRGDPQVVLDMLGDILQRCTTCHAGYRFDVAAEGN